MEGYAASELKKKVWNHLCSKWNRLKLLYGMQLISWCSFSSALFTVKLRQCVICIIMSQECVLILTASFYYCCSQPWINPAWNLERWWVYSGDIHFRHLLNLSSLWCKTCERMTLALQPRKCLPFGFFSLFLLLSVSSSVCLMIIKNFSSFISKKLLLRDFWLFASF